MTTKSVVSLWSQERQPRGNSDSSSGTLNDSASAGSTEPQNNIDESRSVFQQDYDRLLFSTPVRRLSDKTQVWPMDENDGVRTRLTHSHEVANLARSIGSKAHSRLNEFSDLPGGKVSLLSVVQPLLLSIGLSHDLGNPPFGHQGEAAIGAWFKRREGWIFTHLVEGGGLLEDPVSDDQYAEFSEFDGNPQGLRLLSRLQSHVDNVGLDLTAATLAAGLKYPVAYSERNDENPSAKKGGYFESERSVVEWIRSNTGLGESQRHPITWIMEACDDIAYSVLDVDDVLKKGMMSPDDVFVILSNKNASHPVLDKIKRSFSNVDGKRFLPEMLRDIKIQYLRAHLIESLIEHATDSFVDNAKSIFGFSHKAALMDSSKLCESLKEVARLAAFNHPSVLRAEALGAAAIDGLMTELWSAIANRKKFDDIRSKRLNARDKYVYSLISHNYIEQACCKASSSLPLRYRELRLLTDMVSGMTDTFAIRMWENLKAIPYVDCPK